MQFQPLPQRRHLDLLGVFFQIRVDTRRRHRRGRSQHVFKNPAAASYGRRSRSYRADGEESALSEDPPAWAGGIERYSPEIAAMNVRYSIVIREALVHKRVVGVEECHDAPVFADDAVEEHFRFSAE